MKEKVCFKCSILKPLSDFYKNKQMGDGHLNKCKVCTKKDVHNHREDNLEKIREYDRNRPNKDERIVKMTEYTKEYREKYPNKYQAHSMLNNAVRVGKLVRPTACETCSSDFRIVAHHNDYLKPLEVSWLCEVCHKAWHNENGEGMNGN